MRNKIFFIIFIIVWVVIILFNFIIPSKSFSEQENRYLAKMPEFNFKDLVSGKYIENMDNYINDHFIARNFWLKLNSFSNILSGKTENNGVYIGKDGYLFEKFQYSEQEKNNVEKITNAINNFTSNVQVPIYFILVPNSIYINKEKLPDNVEVYNQEKIIKEFYGKLKRTRNIDVSSILLNKNKEQQLYFMTDHHMTSDGAYLVYLEFCNKANIPAKKIEELKKEVISNDFLGTFDSKAQIPNQKTDIIVVYKNSLNEEVEGDYDGEVYNSIFNSEYLNGKDKYSYFLNGNHSKVVIKTKVNNGKKLLVLKDSYAHIMAQFLCQNYEEIHFIDTRYYKAPISDYIKNEKITETLFLYNVSNIVNDISLRIIK